MQVTIYTFPVGGATAEQRLPVAVRNDEEGFALEPHLDGTATLWEWDHDLSKWEVDWYNFSSCAKAVNWLVKATRKDNVKWVHITK
jgi:hypothetical protein